MNSNPTLIEDLEEGEIVENDEDIECLSTSKCKKSLPRRYILEENKNIRSKHKKRCRHSSRHQVKKKSNLKKFPLQYNYHKDKEFCSKHGEIKRTVRRISSVEITPKKSSNIKNHELNSNSLFSEITESLKCFKTSPKITNSSYTPNIPNSFPFYEKFDFPKISNNAQAQNDLRHQIFEQGSSDNCTDESISQKINPVISSNQKIIVHNDQMLQHEDLNSVKSATPIVHAMCEKNESEDEDELRRQALASCAKMPVKATSIKNEEMELENKSYFSTSSQNNLCDEKIADNYEVVDMELDDNQSNGETIDDLFVIDTNPFVPDTPEQTNESGNKDQPSVSQLDDEFEEQLLRAELLANLNSKKNDSTCNNNSKKINMKNNVALPNSGAKLHPKSVQLKSYSLTKHLKASFKKNNCANKINSLKRNQNPKTVFRNPPKRIVISLGDESSSEESDVETSISEKSVKNNCVNSLDALISDARKKSDQSKVNVESVNVSCLSEAQQQEYNFYMKILNANKSGQTVDKNSSAHSAEDELNLNEKKLFIAQKNYMKEKKMTSNELKEVLRKKAVYTKSKLNAELISKQLIAAEKLKKSNLLMYQKAVAHLRTLKKNLIVRKEHISNIEENCTKLGVSLRGNNYTLPTFTVENPSIINKTNS